MAASLVVSGALTWLLVRDLEVQNAQDELARSVPALHLRLSRLECMSRLTRPDLSCQNIGTLRGPATAEQFVDDMRTLSTDLAGDRLLLLDRGRNVVFDSANPDTAASNQAFIPLGNTREVAGETVQTGQFRLGDTEYIGAAAALNPVRNPLRAAFMVVARPRNLVAAQATASLAPRLLVAGGVSLAIAVVLALLVSRMLTRPLVELAAASEDIAAGNYSRRVNLNEGGEVGLVGKAFNRMAEAVERARQTQREFLANVSHELKTPLTSLIGFSQALVDGSLDGPDEQKRAATIIHEESERVLRMAQELLDLARVEAGQVAIRPQPIDLASMLQQEVEIVRRRASERGLTIVLESSPALPPAIADPERLHQVLDNLLDNAVKYAAQTTQVLMTAAEMGEGRLEVQVANPVGEHRPDPQRMFERFYRADPSRSSVAGGVGLGLAISRELAQAMGGRLWADYDRNGWLRVRLELPAERRRPEVEPKAKSTVRISRQVLPPA